MHVITEDIIEASHNGIVPWEKNKKNQPLLIQGKDDYSKTKERWVIIKEYFEKNDIEYNEIFSVDGSILSKLIQLIYLFDYTSIYLSVIKKIDPTPVIPINFIKKKLEQSI